MKKILLVLLLIISIGAFSQTKQPSSNASVTTNGWYILRSVRDSFYMYFLHDTFPALYPSQVFHPNGRFYYTVGSPSPWIEFGATSLSDGLIHIDSIKATGSFQITCYASVGTPTTWRISSVGYAKSTNNVFTITVPTSGFVRKDIIVANTSSNLVVVQGVQSNTVAVAPAVPANTVLVTTLDVNTASVSPSPPDLSNYVTLNTAQTITAIKTLNARLNTKDIYATGNINLTGELSGTTFTMNEGGTFGLPTGYLTNINGSLGNNDFITKMYFDSLSSGGGGNTIYTGNGRFLNDRTVSAANHFLTFDSVNAFKVNIVNGLAFQGIDYQGDGTLAFYSNDGTNQYNPLLLTSDGVLNLNSNNLSGAEYAIFDIGSSGMHMASVDASNTASLVRMTLNGGVDTATLALTSSYFKVNNTHIKSFNAQSQNGDNANSFIAESDDGLAPSYTMSNLSAAANFKYSSLISYGSILGMYYLDDSYNRGTAIWESNAFLKSGTPNSYLTTLAALDNTGGSDKNASLLVHGGNGIGIQTASSISQYGITYLRNDNLPNATSQTLQLPNATTKTLAVSVNGNFADANGNVTVSGGGLTLNDVLTNGNASLLSAKVDSIYLYDDANASYSAIHFFDDQLHFSYTNSGSRIIFENNSSYLIDFNGNTITGDRGYTWPNADGTFALRATDSTSTPINMIYQGLDGLLHKAAYKANPVTSVSVVSANGFAGSVATSTTTPAITLSTTITGILKGNGTAISAATAGTDYLINSNFVTNEEFTGSTSSTYTLANTPVASSLDVYKNGVKLPSSEYSFVGTTVTLVSARVSGDIISNSYRK